MECCPDDWPQDDRLRFYRNQAGKVIKFDYLFFDDGFRYLDGKYAKVWHYSQNPVTAVSNCDICGVIGSPRKVRHRDGVWGWNFEHPEDYRSGLKINLCRKCYFKALRIKKRTNEYFSIRSQIRKLEREIQNERKNQNYRATS